MKTQRGDPGILIDVYWFESPGVLKRKTHELLVLLVHDETSGRGAQSGSGLKKGIHGVFKIVSEEVVLDIVIDLVNGCIDVLHGGDTADLVERVLLDNLELGPNDAWGAHLAGKGQEASNSSLCAVVTLPLHLGVGWPLGNLVLAIFPVLAPDGLFAENEGDVAFNVKVGDDLVTKACAVVIQGRD